MSANQSSSSGLSLEQALGALDRLTSSEKHFDGMKSTCRSLASTWLLATFGALGFLLTEDFHGAFPLEVVALALGMCGAIGIFLLWVLDLLVYHRLLDASFMEGLELEAAFPQAPQVRHRMISSQPGGQTPFYEAWFYIGGVVAPVALSGALFIHSAFAKGAMAGVCAAAGLVILLAITVAYMRRMSPNPAVPKALHACA